MRGLLLLAQGPLWDGRPLDGATGPNGDCCRDIERGAHTEGQLRLIGLNALRCLNALHFCCLNSAHHHALDCCCRSGHQ